MRSASAGFTWIEMIMVLAVIGILALMAIPGMQDSTIKRQVRDALPLADVAKAGVQLAWTLSGELPANNEAAGIPPREKIVGTYVKDVNVEEGAITLTFGNSAHKLLQDRKLTLRPAVVADQRMVPISWLCHRVNVPTGMEVRGRDQTDIPPNHLPVDCRTGDAK